MFKLASSWPFAALAPRLARGQGAALGVRDQWLARTTASFGGGGGGERYFVRRATGEQQWDAPVGYEEEAEEARSKSVV